MKKIYYIANIRIPTERAHSLQVMKMCEVFALSGRDVELIIPNKRDNMGESEVFKYYGVKDIFKIRRVRSTDFLGKTRRLGKVFFWIDLATFLVSLYLSENIEEGSALYSRDPILLMPFLRKQYSVFMEIHDIQSSQPFFLSLLRRVDKVVAITSHLKNILIKNGVKENKIIVAPDAVDLKDFDISISKEESRKQLDLPQEKKIVMYIGLFDDWKGYKTLLESSKFLKKDCQIVMIGGDKVQVDYLQNKYPNVIFLGFRPYNMLPHNQMAADVFVIPNSSKMMISKYFTSPLKLFAHMASRIPIIASDLPSLREIIDESTAYFFTPDDPKNLAGVIEYVLSNHEEAKQKAEKAFMEVKKYSWQKRAEKILQFI